MAVNNYGSTTPRLRAPGRVPDIDYAHSKRVPLYTLDGVYRVINVIFHKSLLRAEVNMVRVDIPEEEYPQKYERWGLYKLDGRLPGWEGNHQLTIVAEMDSVAYRTEYPQGFQPDTVKERDTYLREVMYPRMSEHEMD